MMDDGITEEQIKSVDQILFLFDHKTTEQNEELVNLHPGLVHTIDTCLGYPMLSVAVVKEHVSLVKFLLEHGADVNPPPMKIGIKHPAYKWSHGEGFVGSPIHLAARNGNSTILQMLVEAGADVECTNYPTTDLEETWEDSRTVETTTPVQTAGMYFHYDAVYQLALLGADLGRVFHRQGEKHLTFKGTRNKKKMVIATTNLLTMVVSQTNNLHAPPFTKFLIQRCGAQMARYSMKLDGKAKKNRNFQGKKIAKELRTVRTTAMLCSNFKVVGVLDELSTCSHSRNASCKIMLKSTASNNKKCSACNSVFYCCVEHQKLDWNAHKKDCKSIKKMIKARQKRAEKEMGKGKEKAKKKEINNETKKKREKKRNVEKETAKSEALSQRELLEKEIADIDLRLKKLIKIGLASSEANLISGDGSVDDSQIANMMECDFLVKRSSKLSKKLRKM